MKNPENRKAARFHHSSGGTSQRKSSQVFAIISGYAGIFPPQVPISPSDPWYDVQYLHFFTGKNRSHASASEIGSSGFTRHSPWNTSIGI